MRFPKLTRDHEVQLAAAMLAVACTLAFAPDAFLPMLARAFLMQWAVLFAALAVWSLWRRRHWTFGAAAFSACMVLLQVDAPVAELPVNTGAADLRIAQFNLLQPNRRHDEVVRMALASNADVLSFQEVSPAWAAVLDRALADAYPHAEVVPGEQCYGIALYSRRPVERMTVHHLGGSPVIEAEITGRGGPVRVFSVHATSPGSLAEHRARNAQLRALAGLVRSRGGRTIVVGDLNTVSWDRAMWGLCASSGLRMGTAPRVPTFPSVLGLALIPIDHVLVTPGASVVRSGTFVIPGSDHRGLIADIAT